MDDETTPDIATTYNRIATHFDKTREHPWPEVAGFIEDQSATNIGFDLGCGNGRHTRLLSNRCNHTIGGDISTDLLQIARSRHLTSQSVHDACIHYIHCDACAIPLPNGSVDIALFIATLHHLQSDLRRLDSLLELNRILRPGGVGLISVWSTAHDRFSQTTSFDTLIDWTLPTGDVVPRYYHIFSPEDFEDLLAQSPLTVVDTFISHGNCYAQVRRSQTDEQKHPLPIDG